MLSISWKELIVGRFRKRVNRFKAEVYIGNKVEEVYVPNPSSLEGLLTSGNPVYLVPSKKGKTNLDLLAVYVKGKLVSIDSRIPNILFKKALAKGKLKDFVGFEIEEENVKLGNSTIDFLLKREEEHAYVELKSCSLALKGEALFPEVPTKRGAQQLLDLAYAVERGYKAFIVWIVQRYDVSYLRPSEERDPKFKRALLNAINRGVVPLAYRTRFNGLKLDVLEEIPVKV